FHSVTPEAYYNVDEGQSVFAQSSDVLALMAGAIMPPVEGRIEASGQHQMWWNPTLGGDAGRGATILLSDKWGQIVSHVVDMLSAPPVVNPSLQLCLDHRVRFHDEGRKVGGQMEQYRSSSQGRFPA